MKIDVRALASLNEFLAIAPDAARQAASISMNSVIERRGMPRYRQEIGKQVAFGRGYLADEDRFGVTRKARPTNLEVVISARQRPTSLARFASGVPGQEGVTVQVKPGRSRRLAKAFKVRLRAGTALNNDNFNIGLAVRVKGGQFRNKRDTSRMVRLAPDVFLLYGPSIDQVFRAVSQTETPEVLDEIETEFFRQFARLTS